MEQAREVVVVGGGIAGLTAAWHLRHRDVLLLEAGDRLGGRMRSDTRGEHWLNYGAHLFPAPGSIVDSLARDCGLETVPVPGSMMGIAVGDRQLTTGPVETYPFRLPLSIRDRVAFARAGLKMQRAVARYLREDDVLAYEDDRTFADFLGPLPPAVEQIFACAAHRATAELDELSAGCGIGLFALVWGGKGSLIARNMLGGTGRLPEAIGQRLGADRVKVRAAATGIRPDGHGLAVDYVENGEPRCVRARHVVVAAQAPFAAPLIRAVAPDAADALAKMRYGAFLNVAVATKEQGPMPWDGIYAMATPGRVFDMFTNQAHALRRAGIRRPGGSLMLFAGGQGAAALIEQADEAIAGRFVDDLVRLYPEASGIVEDAVVQRWPLGNVFAQPGRHRLQQPLEGALGAGGNLHLAGDYFAELGNLEAAAKTGASAAQRVDRLLSDPTTEETTP